MKRVFGKVVEDQLILLTVVSLLLAIAIGANDETFAPVTGSKLLSVNKAVLLGAVVLTVGAVTFGFNIAKEVGTQLTSEGGTEDLAPILTILFSVSVLLILGSSKGLPLSTTHTMVGSVVTLALIRGNEVDTTKILTILASWFISPILGFFGSYYTMKAIIRLKKSYIRGLDDVDRLETLFSKGLIIAVIITAFSRGANDVSNAVAPIMASYLALATDPANSSLIARVPLLLAGICMGIGLILIGRRVLKTLGNDVVELSPTTAVSVQVSTAFITFFAALALIPISGTHVLVAAFVGTGKASGAKVNMDSVKRISVSAVATPFASALTTLFMWFVIFEPLFV